MLMSFVIFFGVFGLISFWLLPLTVSFLAAHHLTSDNYKLKKIPNGLGIYLWSLFMIYFLMIRLWEVNAFPYPFGKPFLDVLNIPMMYNYVLMLSLIFFVGWLDDSIGDRTIKGFKGHISKWKHSKTLSTGLLKAGVTGLISFWAVLELGSPWLLGFLQVLLIVLMTNAVNLLDLRPGRALKGFLCVAVVTMALGYWIMGTLHISLQLLFPVVIGALFLLPSDLKAETMIGDAGANFLGFAAGFSIVCAAPIWFQTIVLLMLVGMHWIGERGSITKLIEKNRMLNWFDKLGRES